MDLAAMLYIPLMLSADKDYYMKREPRSREGMQDLLSINDISNSGSTASRCDTCSGLSDILIKGDCAL